MWCHLEGAESAWNGLKWVKMSWHLCTGKSSSNNYDVVDGRLIPRRHHADLLRPRLDLVLCHSNKVELHSPSSTSKPVTKVTRSRVKNTEWNRTDATYTKVNTVRTQFWNWGRESRLREQNSHLSKLRHFPFRKNNKPFHCLSFLIVPVKKMSKSLFWPQNPLEMLVHHSYVVFGTFGIWSNHRAHIFYPNHFFR